MDYGLLMPEVNSGRMYAGPGAGPLLAAAAAWNLVAAQLESAAASYLSSVSGMTGLTWFGPSSVSMAAAATRYVAWLQVTAAAAQQTSAQAYAAAAAYEAAFAMTVPPPVIAANRAQLMVLIATNFFGQNTPAIAACEAQYLAMWAQDAAAMYMYAADSSAASIMTPFQEPPQTTNDAGQDAQAQSVAQTVGNTTSARTQSLAQLTSSTYQTAANPLGVDPPLDVGQSANIATGGATVDPGIAITATSGNPATVTTGSHIYAVSSLVETFSGGATLNLPAGTNFSPGSVVTLSGTFYYVGGGSVTLPQGSVTGTTITVPAFSGFSGATLSGADVTELGGLVTAVNSGAITSGPAVVPVVPSSGALAAAAPAAAVTSSPGLAGTAGIQPQLDVDALLKAFALEPTGATT